MASCVEPDYVFLCKLVFMVACDIWRKMGTRKEPGSGCPRAVPISEIHTISQLGDEYISHKPQTTAK